jgi:hypothetical protein
MNQSSSLFGLFQGSSLNDSAFGIVVFCGDTVCTLPDDSSAKQSYHTDNGEDDSVFVPKHQLFSLFA